MSGIEKLNELIELSNDPIVLKDTKFKLTGQEVIIEANTPVKGISERYIDGSVEAPDWYKDLMKINSKRPILIINNINSIDEVQQARFLDLIKYKKVGSFTLPENTLILITYYSSEKYKLNESIASLVMHM